MSIYSSCLNLGLSSWAKPGDEHYTPPDASPRAYQRSHKYPSVRHPRAYLDTASIPHWCVPGHDDAGDNATCSTCGTSLYDGNENAPWLRLMIGGDAGNYTIVIPAAGVELLRDHLTEWLDTVWTEGEQ